MAKNQKNTNSNNSSSSNSSSIMTVKSEITTTKVVVKRKRKSVPRGTPPKRSSIYRGVTRHRWTGRYEAHLWDKNCWNESQNKKGRQVYLGAYDGEEAAAHAYDLAALKYWGQETILNFPVSTYVEELKEMEGQSKEEYIGSLRRRSSGFSRGVSKYRGVARQHQKLYSISQAVVKILDVDIYQLIRRIQKKSITFILETRYRCIYKLKHHHNGRWEARIGRVFGNKYLYLGTYATQEEAATAYDMAAIEYRGLNAVTNFDLSRYIKWLKPDSTNPELIPAPTPNPNQELALTTSCSAGETETSSPVTDGNDLSTLGCLYQSTEFKEMLESTSSVLNEESSLTTPESDPPRCSFPDDIQTYFECQDSGSYVEDDDILFDFNSFSSPVFQCELDL